MTGQLNSYKSLLEQYHQEIDVPGWDKRLQSLTIQMERYWSKLNQQDRETALAYAHELYLKRIGD